MRNSFELSETQIDAFQADGVVLLKHLLSPEDIALLIDGANLTLASPSSRARVASTRDDPGRFFEDFCLWQSNPHYTQFIRASPLAWVASRLMRSQQCRFYHDHFLVKEPGTTTRTPWHQDQPYYGLAIAGQQNCSFWIPLDSVARESALEFVRGSHKGPVYHPYAYIEKKRQELERESMKEFGETMCESVVGMASPVVGHSAATETASTCEDSVLLSRELNIPDIENNRAQFDVVGWEMEPGDVVCFHMKTLHGAGGVDIHHRRRVYVARFIGDDTRYHRKFYASPSWPELEQDQELNDGDEMKHPLFPLLVGASHNGI